MAAVLLLLSSDVVLAQNFGRVEQTESTSPNYYSYYQPGFATVQVHVIGSVPSPGLYEINEGTDLGVLMALAGGPSMDIRESRARRRIELRLFRGGETPIFQVDLADSSVNPDSYPVLEEGDVFRVDVIDRTRFSWRDALQIATASLGVIFLADRITGN